ncbi:MAG: TRAP transporter fused permease subunit, partial [Dehalococcoidia bacterium]|nr:TRAP transporter fused permease subunit [Dehalococcoidia bacterium]
MSEETGELRHYTGLRGIIVTAISVSLPCYVLVFNVLDVPFRMGFYFYPEAYNAVFLAISLVMLFLLVPGSRNDLKGLPWYDVLLIGASLLVTLYIFFKAETIALAMNIYTSSFEQVLGLIAFLVLCEAIRRTVGWPIILVTLIFLLHAKFAYLFPGLLGGPVYSWSRLAAYMYLYDTGIFGMITEIAGTIIIGFIVFGRLMIEVGAGKFLSDLALGLAGHFRGGAAKVAVVASAFFGMVSGSPLANVGTTGVITIPLMKKIGYKPEFAAAVESVASTGGMLTPPVMGAVAFIMADFTKITYGRICAAAILPAILYFFSLFVQIDFEALKIGSRGLPRNELPSLKKTIREGWHLMLP